LPIGYKPGPEEVNKPANDTVPEPEPVGEAKFFAKPREWDGGERASV
jgi:hypothetical protein